MPQIDFLEDLFYDVAAAHVARLQLRYEAILQLAFMLQ